VPSLLKIKNLELVVPWSIEPTNSSEEPISMLLEEVRETVTKVVSILHVSSRDGEARLYVTFGQAEAPSSPCTHFSDLVPVGCNPGATGSGSTRPATPIRPFPNAMYLLSTLLQLLGIRHTEL
jgi:hypothetical protein